MIKVLLADDSVTIRKVVELILPESFQLTAVKSGTEALNLLSSFGPDIVLADIEMPSMNGYQLCEKIKGNPATSSIPVLLLAGAFEPLDEGLAARVGADGHIIKPFEAEDLMGRINGLLGAKAGASGEEDLWEMEGLKEEEVEVVEEVAAEDAEEPFSVEALEELGGAMAVEAVAEPVEAFEEAFEEPPAAFAETAPARAFEERPPQTPAAQPFARAAMPDAAALTAAFRASADEKLAEVLGKADIKEIILEALRPQIKESVENVLWEVAPQLAEKLIKEALTDTMSTLKKEVENVIWETVPEIAETIIRKEIEKIRAEKI